MIELTDEQRRELQAEVPRAIDPTTQKTYVLVSEEVYQRIKGLLYDAGEWTDDELRLHLARSAAANGWDEPGMDAYDRYDENRSKPCP